MTSQVQEKKKKKYLLILWALFFTPLITLTIIFILISKGQLGYMPSFEELENPDSDFAAQVISEDGYVFGKIGRNSRVRTEYEELSPYIVDALIATEDVRFRRHSGIDLKSLVRAVIYLGKRGGASTISQQLAKQLYTQEFEGSSIIKRIWQKLNEWVIAVLLERRYTKEEIIGLYLNQFDYLNLAVGIQSASKVYFNSNPDSLTVEQSATLIGMLKNPYLFNPRRRPELTEKRRNVVLSQMVKYGYLSSEEFDSISLIPLTIDFQAIGGNEGYGTYFREYLRLTMQKHEPQRKKYSRYESYQTDSTKWADDPLYGWCNKNKKPNGDPYDIYGDGLKIFTTVNYKLQKYAEWAVAEHIGKSLQNSFYNEKKGNRNAPFPKDFSKKTIEGIIKEAMYRSDRYRLSVQNRVSKDSIMEQFHTPTEMTVFSWRGDIDTVMTPWDSLIYYKYFLNTGLLSVDPLTGEVKAYVGGINKKYFAYDHVTQAKRQAGSTFKPFLYILAMEEYSPCYKVPVVEQTFQLRDTTWTPRTTLTDPKILGTEQPLKWGLAKSENYVSAWLLKRFAPEPIVEVAHKMGIESYIDPVPSMIYGSSNVTVYEMVGAFATFANKGVHIKPYFVSRIEDKNGNILGSFIPEKKEAIDEKTAYLMLNLMEGVVNFGTAAILKRPKEWGGWGMKPAQIAGKTGTTNDHADGWFIGITPNLVTGIWVGGDDGAIHFDQLGLGAGSHMALPIWGYYMEKVYNDSTLLITKEDIFEKPANFELDLNCDEQNSESNNAGEYEPIDYYDY